MFDDMFKGMGNPNDGNCGCDHSCDHGCHEKPKPRKCSTSCDVLWMIILLMIVFKGGFFGLDLCTLIILFIVFGKDIMGKLKCNPCGHCC